MIEAETFIRLEKAPKTAWVDKLTRLERMAIERIRELERDILKTYGLKTACGIELEYFRYDIPGHKPVMGLKGFSDSHVVERSFQESSGNHLFEIVLGKGVGTFYGKEEMSYEELLKRISPSKIANSAAIVRKLIEDNGHERGFKPLFSAISTVFKDDIAATQVALSLWNGNKNLLQITGDKVTPFISQLGNKCAEIQSLTCPLIVHSDDSLQRLKYAGSTLGNYHVGTETDIGMTKSIRHKGPQNNDMSRFEFRLAGGDCSPVIETLVNLSAMSYALSKIFLPNIEKKAENEYTSITTSTGTFHIRDELEGIKTYKVPRTKAGLVIALEYLKQSSVAKEMFGHNLHTALVENARDNLINVKGLY